MKNEKEVVLAAVKQNGDALEYASEGMKNDKKVVLAALAQNGNALQFASEEMQNDKEVNEVMLAAASKFTQTILNLNLLALKYSIHNSS